ncbi:Mak10 subunit, NatC N-terminal acetyltransferase-domain-containing protein [Abortiporus biennis]|nr:Mak10 subunit, NatC N-terminal acetyltransferase-domain-containing protein [Abortiporus biennis]
MSYLDLDYLQDLPGGDDFEDVTDLFDQAANDMNEGQFVLTDGFTLMDAMSAFEIGEPRMDSGMIIESEQRPPFDPLAPLLPQELCWILDRSFACEMEWHAGNTLSQTVYTLLHVHHLSDIDPDVMMQEYGIEDPLRPQGLVTIALRAGVLGLIKSCDMAWRELSKGKIADTEDWQSEKCDISLMEGVPVEYAIQNLNDACIWVHSAQLSPEDGDSITNRLLLRKALLELFRLDVTAHLDNLNPLIRIARNHLNTILTQPQVPTPVPGSPALLAIDPHITRRLHNFIPIRMLELPDQDQVWASIDQLLKDWEELDKLLHSDSISAWDVGGLLGVWSPNRPPPVPFIRALAQTAFYDKNFFFGIHPLGWIVDRFFLESTGFSFDSIQMAVSSGWVNPQKLSFRDFEKHVAKIMTQHIRSYYFNRPRRRRFLMKSMVDWQQLVDSLQNLTTQLVITDPHTSIVISALPSIGRTWQLTIAREIIMSGFQQELYSSHERPISYWYAAKVMELHLAVNEKVQPAVRSDSPAYAELIFQSNFLTALRLMCLAICAITFKEPRISREQLGLAYKRRYKWNFVLTFPDNREERLVSIPDLDVFFEAVKDLAHSSTEDMWKNANEILSSLAQSDLEDFWDTRTARERLQFVRELANTCEQFLCFLRETEGSPLDISKLAWDPSKNPWFPVILKS